MLVPFLPLSLPQKVCSLFLEENCFEEHTVVHECFLLEWGVGPSKDAVAVGEAVYTDAGHGCIQFRHHQLWHLQHSLVICSSSSSFKAHTQLSRQRAAVLTPAPAGLHNIIHGVFAATGSLHDFPSLEMLQDAGGRDFRIWWCS